MKRQRTNSLKSSSQQLNSSSDLDLPDDCYLKSLSVVSKHFLSITNHYKFSLTILYPTLLVLPRLLQRFTKLTSLNLSSYYGDLDALLTQISRYPLKLTLLISPTNSLFPLMACEISLKILQL